MLRYHWIVFVVVVGLLVGCATKQDVERLESKVDQLIQATNRSTLDEIFGNQASQISLMVSQLDLQQKQNFENLQQEYANGTMAVEQVQQKMLTILGNNDRVVSTRRGIYIRNLEGAKLKAISNETKIANCHLVPGADIPAVIREKQVLDQFSWGRGELDGKTILFPWELTISSLTKEIAEYTAKRTAQEFIEMGGEKQWKRPIRIQISTEKEDQIKVTTNEEENEVYFEYQAIDSDKRDRDTVTEQTMAAPSNEEKVGPRTSE